MGRRQTDTRSYLKLAMLIAVAAALLSPTQTAAAATGGLQFKEKTATTGPQPGGADATLTPPVPEQADGEPLTEPSSGEVAQVLPSGLAVAPAGAPPVVAAIIAAGNRIATKKYLWGGGHRRWNDRGYDCSGSVSYALHGAGLLQESMTSGGFMRWGKRGRGRWVTIYASRGHMYMVVAGLRFDTSGKRRTGTRWQSAERRSKGFRVRHPAGL